MTMLPRTFTGFLDPGDPRWPEALGRVRHDLFHLPGYLQACARAEPGEPRLFLLDAGTHGMLVPLMLVSLASFGASYRDHLDAVSPYGYAGPLYWGAPAPELLAVMHRRVLEELRRANVVSLFLRLHPFLATEAPVLEALAGLGEVRTLGPVVYLDLGGPDGGWRGINAGNRRAIRRGLRAGCSVAIDRWETMDQVMAAYAETMERHEAPASYLFPGDFFRLLRQGAGPHLHLATCFDPRGEVTGGVFFSEVAGLVQYFLTGSFTRFAHLSPSKLLVNALRIWGVERGCHTLNLGGGVGARQDNLFTFKIRMSSLTAGFRTLRRVVLEEPYRALGAGFPADSGFFPCYGRPDPYPMVARGGG